MATGKATANPQRGRRRQSAEAVERELARLTAGPACQPGTRLPTERALAERLDVPRSAVRAGLDRLETEGRIIRIVGNGTFVTKPARDPRGDVASGSRDASPKEIMETRLLIEPALAALVVAHANSADMERIEEAMRGAEAARDFEDFEVWDGRFHQAIADATHNRLVIEVYRTITVARDFAEWGDLKRKSITIDRRAAYEAEHRDIVAALRSRDGGRAEATLGAHLLNVRRNLLGF